MATVTARSAPATPAELSAYLKLSTGTLRNWRYQGKGPAYERLENGHVRYPWTAIEAWERKQAQT